MVDVRYRYDRQLWHDIVIDIVHDEELSALLHGVYDDRTLLILLSELKKTLFGAMLWMVFEEKNQTPNGLEIVYLRDVLHVDEILWTPLRDILHKHRDSHHELLTLRTQIDDNPSFLAMCSDMRQDFQKLTSHTLSTEDILRLHSTFHHLSSYNMRYVIPE